MEEKHKAIARKCEIKHWFPCGMDGRSLGREVYGHVNFKFSRIDRFTKLWGSAHARVELHY